MKRHILCFGMLCAIFALLGVLAVSPARAMQATVDVSQAFSYINSYGQQVNLPAVNAVNWANPSTPQQITAKFLGLLRYFGEMGLAGSIRIPAGTWQVTQTLYLETYDARQWPNYYPVNLYGAGQTTTILQAAPGYEDMPVVMLNETIQQPNLDLNAYHRPQVTGVGMLDSSVTGPCYGYRTLSVPPSSVISDRSVWEVGTVYNVNDYVVCNGNTFICTTANTGSSANQPGPNSYWQTPPSWATGQNYAVNNVVALNSQQVYVCTVAHTSDTTTTEPNSGTNWRGYWRQIHVYADGYVECSPLTAGPLDPATNNTQATYWQDTQQLTLDVCVTNNSNCNMNGTICGVEGGSVGSSWLGSTWNLSTDGNEVYFDIVQPSTITNLHNTVTDIRCTIGSGPLGPGTHRLSVQLDFRNGQQYVAAWVDNNQQTVNGSASYALPAGISFLPYNAGGFYLGRTTDTGANGFQNDWTFSGLHLSATNRYAVATSLPSAQQWVGGGAVQGNDNTRFFINDSNTIAYLPLADAPPADTDYTNSAWCSMTVQSGKASTPAGLATPPLGYGWWNAGYQRKRLSRLADHQPVGAKAAQLLWRRGRCLCRLRVTPAERHHGRRVQRLQHCQPSRQFVYLAPLQCDAAECLLLRLVRQCRVGQHDRRRWHHLQCLREACHHHVMRQFRLAQRDHRRRLLQRLPGERSERLRTHVGLCQRDHQCRPHASVALQRGVLP